MSVTILLLLALGLGLAGWLAGRARAWSFRRSAGAGALAALPSYHAWYVALWIVVPMVVFIAAWSVIGPQLVSQHVLASPAAADLPAFGFKRESLLAEARAVATGAAPAVFNDGARALVEPYREAIGRYQTIGIVVALLLGFLGGAWSFLRIKPDFTARTRVERTVMVILLLASLVAILTTLGIFVSLVFETVRFFGMVNPIDFLFGLHWGPDPMANPDNPDPSRYGAIPLFWGTIFIGAIIAMIVAIPLGLMSAIYLTQYADPRLRSWVKPALEILAGVPTVVYGYFAALTVAPFIRDLALALGASNPSSESALAAGLVMGVMIIPFVSSMADDSIAAVPQAMRDGSLAMGATTSETIRRVLVPAALPGIVAGVMLAISRAIGETMIVVMAASTAANLSANPLEAMTTVTVQIVAMLTGEGSFDHPATLSAFALGFVLFLVTLGLNFVALRVVKRFREAYE
ncbi:phosphate ABC transporter permease subunit PstC [Pelagerythrobacter marinus]|uniref:Phosphate transport system permease protein n=1 Tax=Pelagerythrobacter marinus TaxID=538382 RepID=A0ABW9UU17_9SPHN|nr:phosphate ABC transporter permease subunit PstC [Pelagerythrobacter marinus]MEC9066746.1 phosphate ABC transporter permease subunit PstC [Pseudomonadota bacterium]MXO68349.1 phosphate ABC transporter permease subunit PstC [Pelagerythrobacter marinus]USA40494.1 phosphate ABC transporter permease subunit PstC [Pelagerythrobacter marinus]WPZ08336.1 phosphate ABC transporter permease subunit PstC [Pelagerythrobacter marinus]